MRLSDPMLAIGPRETHTVEWMLLPQGPNCSTYWCYINKLRHDFGTDTIAVGGNAGPAGFALATGAGSGGEHQQHRQALRIFKPIVAIFPLPRVSILVVSIRARSLSRRAADSRACPWFSRAGANAPCEFSFPGTGVAGVASHKEHRCSIGCKYTNLHAITVVAITVIDMHLPLSQIQHCTGMHGRGVRWDSQGLGEQGTSQQRAAATQWLTCTGM